MTYENSEQIFICSECIGNDLIASFIKEQSGISDICSIEPSHSDNGCAIPYDELIEVINEQFRHYYSHGEEKICLLDDSDRMDREQMGENLINCLEELLICDYGLAKLFAEELQSAEYIDVSSGELPFYNDFYNYELKKDVIGRDSAEAAEYWYENRIHFKWNKFSKDVKYKNRFFNIKSQLDELFEYADSYHEGDRKPIYNIKTGTFIYRARKLDDGSCYEEIKDNPTDNLGPPPYQEAVSGRMNPQHIPVFYGAFSSNVAICELQPFIRERIALGKFSVTKEIKVFDFTVYDKIFDDKYSKHPFFQDTRYDVFSYMQHEISKPICAKDRSLEYLPTQIISEYIKEHFKVDAIIYFSSLVPEDSKFDRRNIAIFNQDKLEIESKDISLKEIRRIDYTIEDELI